MITTSDVFNDGPRNLIVQITGTADGTLQERSVAKIDRRVKIRRVLGQITGGSVTLAWETASGPQVFTVLSGRIDLDNRFFGGVANRNDGSGRVLLSTSGFGPGSSYMLRFETVKKTAKKAA